MTAVRTHRSTRLAGWARGRRRVATVALAVSSAACGHPNSPTGASSTTAPTTVSHEPAQYSAADPIVFLFGGPGGDAILNPPGSEGPSFSHSRDVILMSQRGTHSAQPSLTCPEIDQFFARRLGLVYDAPSTGDEYVKAVKTCHDRLADGTDLSAFNSTESAYDLIDLRNALHVNQWNVGFPLLRHRPGVDVRAARPTGNVVPGSRRGDPAVTGPVPTPIETRR